MKKTLICVISVLLLMSGCSRNVSEPAEKAETDNGNEGKQEETVMKLRINDTEVTVSWQDNEAVEALKKLAMENPLVISMSMYGGFEQVGPIGQSLPQNDRQTTTEAGDIVLYSGNQIVVFYGSNSWAYTRLGRITDKSAEELADLLGNGDVTVTLAVE